MNDDTISRFLEDLTGKYAAAYSDAIHDLYVALVAQDKVGAAAARKRLADATRDTMGMSEVLGARLTLEAAARVLGSPNFNSDRHLMLSFAQSLVPNVTFEEAVSNLVERTPVTVRRAAERTAQRIAELYSQGNVMAFVRAAEASVTREAQSYIERAMRVGMTEGQAAKELAMRVNEVRERSKDWSQAYARLVWRTNVNTAVTAGRFRQAQDPDVRKAVPALRFDAVGDSDTRSNHEAADGMILRTDNPAWNRLAPPLGYNCRCQVSLVSVVELQALGRIDRQGNVKESRIPQGAFPDPGFRHGGRPDLQLGRR